MTKWSALSFDIPVFYFLQEYIISYYKLTAYVLLIMHPFPNPLYPLPSPSHDAKASRGVLAAMRRLDKWCPPGPGLLDT